MKFGKNLRNEIAETLPQWRDEFLSYKVLKKQVNLIAYKFSNRENLEDGQQGYDGKIIEEIDFRELLDCELEKVKTFSVDKEEEYVIRMKELKERVRTIGTYFDTLQLRLDILEFHKELVLLLHYNVINFTGLLKIVKKHHKKTGTSSLLPSTLKSLFTTELICRLLQECDFIINQLFHVN